VERIGRWSIFLRQDEGVATGRVQLQAVRVLAAVFALVAVACMTVAIVGMVTGRPGDRAGVLIRIAAVVCFALAVVLNVLSR
jgi:lipopolysaccharide export LptBFGC system permease protein LptF